MATIGAGEPDYRSRLGCCHPRLQARVSLGLGSGDRFEAFRGGPGPVKEGVLQVEKPAELQGKRATERVFQIA
jgi:hypothetical protein